MRARRLLRSIARMLGASVAAGLVIGSIFSFTRGVPSARLFALNFLVSAVYSAVIGSIGMVAMMWVGPRTRSLPAFAQLVVFLVVLLAAAVVGALAASGVFLAIGLFPADQLWPNYVSGLRVALLISSMAAVGAFLYGRMRHRLDEAERLALAARLASLESRLRPHFLFNALNTVAALIPEDPARAEQTLERVTALLRASLDTTGDVVPLRDELRLVRDYLEIERARFGPRLRFALDVDPAVEGEPVPAFSVQTLVENAVRHGVAARRDGAEVRVVAARRDGRLAIAVSDDGPGFDGTVLPRGRGLDSLRARLDALYGAAARLDIDGAPPGARVTVSLP